MNPTCTGDARRNTTRTIVRTSGGGTCLVTYGFAVFFPHVSLFTGQTDTADFTWTAGFQLHAAIKISDYKVQAGDSVAALAGLRQA